MDRFCRFSRFLLGVVLVSTFLGQFQLVKAQTTFPTGPEGYYLSEYYGLLPPPVYPPPEEMRRQAVQNTITRNGSERITRNFRRLSAVSRMGSILPGSLGRPTVRAGDLFDQVQMSVGHSRARVDDDVLFGKGYDQETSVLVSGSVGENLLLGFGYSYDRYNIGGYGSYLQQTDALDLFLTWSFSESWSLGTFVNASTIDIEDDYRIHPDTGGIVSIGDSFERWGTGLLVAWNANISDSTNLAVVNSITSMNKSSLSQVLDDEDSAWLVMLDLRQGLSDDLSLGMYSTFYYMLDRDEGDPDGSFAMIGSDLSYHWTPELSTSVGYETTAGDNDHEEQRVNISVVWIF